MNPEVTLDEIFAYLNNADKPCLIAIDEFQQITNYGDKRIEALLRTYVQRCLIAFISVRQSVEALRYKRRGIAIGAQTGTYGNLYNQNNIYITLI